ncbi:MAG: PAS domain-containing protein, partial [Phormidesmis sp. CAN_BIN44]|nr:PAS domain-containing protein [Phormidesmis sp. CAN_BIN44]
MQLTELPSPLVTLQQTIDQWIKTVPNHNPELATQLRSSISDVSATIAQFQQQLTWEREQRQRAESEVRFLERMTQAIDQSAILEYQRPEDALAEREELLQTVVTHTPTILYALDRDGIFTLSEGKGLEAMNLKSGEVVGRSIFDLYEDHPDMLQAVHQVLNGAESDLILNLNGVTYDNRVTPLFDQQGDVLGIIGVATDITARKQAEEALRDAKKDLEI